MLPVEDWRLEALFGRLPWHTSSDEGEREEGVLRAGRRPVYPPASSRPAGRRREKRTNVAASWSSDGSVAGAEEEALTASAVRWARPQQCPVDAAPRASMPVCYEKGYRPSASVTSSAASAAEPSSSDSSGSSQAGTPSWVRWARRVFDDVCASPQASTSSEACLTSLGAPSRAVCSSKAPTVSRIRAVSPQQAVRRNLGAELSWNSESIPADAGIAVSRRATAAPINFTPQTAARFNLSGAAHVRSAALRSQPPRVPASKGESHKPQHAASALWSIPALHGALPTASPVVEAPAAHPSQPSPDAGAAPAPTRLAGGPSGSLQQWTSRAPVPEPTASSWHQVLVEQKVRAAGGDTAQTHGLFTAQLGAAAARQADVDVSFSFPGTQQQHRHQLQQQQQGLGRKKAAGGWRRLFCMAAV